MPPDYQRQTLCVLQLKEAGGWGGGNVEMGTKLTLRKDLENRTYKHDPASIPFVFLPSHSSCPSTIG